MSNNIANMLITIYIPIVKKILKSSTLTDPCYYSTGKESINLIRIIIVLFWLNVFTSFVVGW